MSDKITVWIGVGSSIITIILSVMNFNLNAEMQEIDAYVKKVEADLKQKTYELEKSRENTSRYEFINKLMPDLLADDEKHVVLTTNLIALVLDESETEQLFNGLASSKEENVSNVGKIGIETINSVQENKSKYQSAIEYEAKAFDALVNQDFVNAIKYLDMAEKVYPSFHQVYEIKNLLKENIDNIQDEKTKAAVLREIVFELSWKAPQPQLSQLRKMVE
ncbi:hypothetical protein [Vibrio sp. EA2]|uniref:hypothetical protein n=1 Tax=Vibrio sp. EA2 TaxID=3079860 RepID=UPI00294992C9|nr:hypothetical protein [Vibrio sp. EA2]MDV6252312.1 hypothetical protein [Vibrio sp. EA2]